MSADAQKTTGVTFGSGGLVPMSDTSGSPTLSRLLATLQIDPADLIRRRRAGEPMTALERLVAACVTPIPPKVLVLTAAQQKIHRQAVENCAQQILRLLTNARAAADAVTDAQAEDD